MLVRDLIGTLPGAQHQYQGDVDLPFSGLELNPPRKPPRGRFFVTRDASWPITLGDRQHPSRKRSARLIKQAFDQGAAGVICSPDFQGSAIVEGRNAFFTTDTYALARHATAAVRQSLNHQRTTAITGSAGKTTTKNMLLHALRASQAGRLASTPGNRNLYRTILRRLSQSARYDHTVIEAASAAFQTFRETGFSISADVSIVTSIAEGHLDYMKSLENIARVKSDIFQSPPPGGTAIINCDTECSDILVRRAEAEGCRVVTYGESREATIRLLEWNPQTRQAVATMDDECVEYVLGSEGKHTALNSLAVLGALRAHGITNWRDGMDSLASFKALVGRGQTQEIQLHNGVAVTLIDEAYNANAASIRSSVESLALRTVAPGGRRVAVLGDVLELGDHADQVHANFADSVLNADLDEVFLFGQHMRQLYEALRHQVSNVRHWEDLAAMRSELLGLLQQNDVVLLKASGSMGLNELVKELSTPEASKDI